MRKHLLFLGLGAFLFVCDGGTVRAAAITSNAGSATDSNGVTSIVELDSTHFLLNLDATQDGIADSGSDITGNSLVGNPNTVYDPELSLTLQPGTYLMTNAIGSSSADPDFSAWNFESANSTPWVWEFLTVVVPDSSTGDGTVTGNYLPGPYERFAAKSDAAAYGADFSAMLTVTTTETVAFALDDDALGDNFGGVAFELQDIPEPSITWLAVIGFLSILGLRRMMRNGSEARALQP